MDDRERDMMVVMMTLFVFLYQGPIDRKPALGFVPKRFWSYWMIVFGDFFIDIVLFFYSLDALFPCLYCL